MQDINSFKENKQDTFGITLPCKQSDFGEFISSLLGKPQTLEKFFNGIFEITKEDILNTFYLIEQRIHQQNEATLIQFTTKILYSDNSSVLLNSFQDFQLFNEIKPLKSIGVSLSWTYLITFKNKKVPEKQEINLSFNSNKNIIFDDEIIFSNFFNLPNINLRIQHTERTWGIDIESLLTGHIESLVTVPNKFERFVYKYSGTIGFIIGLLFFVSLITVIYQEYVQLKIKYIEKINLLAGNVKNNIDLISLKVNSIFDFILGNTELNILNSLIIFVLISIIISISLGIWIANKLNNKPKSFVLLSKLAEDFKIKEKNKRHTNWILLGLSIVMSIGTSIIASILFKIYIERNL